MSDMVQILSIDCTGLRLPPEMGLARHTRRSTRTRPDAFIAAFDALQLVYDVFWHADGKRIVIVGPPPRNLEKHWKTAKVSALPSGRRLNLRLNKSLSTMLVETAPAPADTDRIELEFAGRTFVLPVQPNLSQKLAGARVLFSMSKNNDLNWIRYWADWHARLHGTDTVFLFDNGSDHYGTKEIEAALASVKGLRTVGVISFPHLFGAFDPAVKLNPFWAHFAQISSMSIVLRRLAGKAQGLLNCDVDELANAPDGRSLYAAVADAQAGLIILPGRWVEPNMVATTPRATGMATHEHFSLVHLNDDLRDSSPVKWILDPNRNWTASLGVHPYWHWIHKRPPFSKSFVKGAFFWHFRGINTGWKDTGRMDNRMDADKLVVDQELLQVRAKL